MATHPTPDRPLTLTIDTGSPQVSLALGAAGELFDAASYPGGADSPSLLGEIDAMLQRTAIEIGQVARVLVAQGPGSFTGLRVGLATALGLHQAVGLQATAVPSFLPLALQAGSTGSVTAAVDALRDEWYVQHFTAAEGRLESNGAPAIVPADSVAGSGTSAVVGFGIERLGERFPSADRVDWIEAEPLAPWLLDLADRSPIDWDPNTLTRPLYLRPPAAKR